MGKIFSSIFRRPRAARRACAIPTKCDRPERQSFNEIMEREWAELVIKFDKNKNDYVFRTACCMGAPAC